MARVLQISVLVLLGCLVLALGIGDAFAAERRIALVIGNSKYKDTNISIQINYCVSRPSKGPNGKDWRADACESAAAYGYT